jgi:hypothetical protein
MHTHPGCRLQSCKLEGWRLSLRPRLKSRHPTCNPPTYNLLTFNRLAQVVAAAVFCCAVPAQAAPRLNWMFPSGGQRGSTYRAEVGGADLQSLTGFFTTGKGVTAKVLPPEQGQDPKTQRAVEITVAPDAPLGGQEVRLVDGTGASNPKVLWVGQYKELREEEPNDSRSQARKVDLPVTINGLIGRGSDIDSYTFSLKKGQTAWVEIHSLRLLANLGDSWLKGYAWIEDSRGTLLAENNGYYRWDPYLQFAAPEDGEYTVSYRDVQYRGGPNGVYRLTISTGPHLWAVFPMGGRRGAATPVRLLGANVGEASKSVTLPADAPEEVRETTFEVGGAWTNPVSFAVSRHPNALEQEPNNDIKAANRVTLPVEVHGIVEKAADVDSFVFSGKKGDRLVVEVLSRGAGLPLDSLVSLRKTDGTLVAENDDGPDRNRDDNRDRDSRLDRTLDADGDYVVHVRDVDERGGPDFVYRLSLRSPQPGFSLQAQNDRPVLKAGSTVILDLALTRSEGFDGEVAVTVEGLPQGVTAESLTIPKGQAAGKLTLRAAAGTPHQAVLLRIWGEAVIGGVKERRLGNTLEVYNTQGTAYRRDLTGPVLVVGQ